MIHVFIKSFVFEECDGVHSGDYLLLTRRILCDVNNVYAALCATDWFLELHVITAPLVPTFAMIVLLVYLVSIKNLALSLG